MGVHIYVNPAGATKIIYGLHFFSVLINDGFQWRGKNALIEKRWLHINALDFRFKGTELKSFKVAA